MVDEKYTINAREGEATLDIFVSGAFETAYSLKNAKVTLSERPNPAVLNVPSYSDNVNSILEWVRILTRIIRPGVAPREKYLDRLKRTGTGVKADYEYKNDVVTDAEFDDTTKLYTFAPRGEVKLGWSDFLGWADFLERFRDEAERK